MPLVKPRPRAPPPIPTDRPASLRTPLGSPSPTGPNFNLHSSSSGSSSPSSSIVRLQANSDNSSSDGGHSTSSQTKTPSRLMLSTGPSGAPSTPRNASSSSSRPSLALNASVVPSPTSSPPPAEMPTPRALPRPPVPLSSDNAPQPAVYPPHLLNDANKEFRPPFAFAGGPFTSSPYESPYIPPPTPTPPDSDHRRSSLYVDVPSPPIDRPRSFPHADDEDPNKSGVTLLDVTDTSDEEEPDDLRPRAWDVPLLEALVVHQQASFPLDQRSSDLTTISEERSSRMSNSTRSNSLATSAGTGASGSRRWTESTLSGGWETLERRGSVFSEMGGRHGGDSMVVDRAPTDSSVGSSITREDGRPSATLNQPRASETGPLVALHNDSEPLIGSPRTLQPTDVRPQGPRSLVDGSESGSSPGPTTVDSSHDSLSTSGWSPRRLSPADQILVDGGGVHLLPAGSHPSPTSLGLSTSSSPFVSPPGTVKRWSLTDLPVRPPRNAQRRLSSGGTVSARPGLPLSNSNETARPTVQQRLAEKELPGAPFDLDQSQRLESDSTVTLQPSPRQNTLDQAVPSLRSSGASPRADVFERTTDGRPTNTRDLLQRGERLNTAALTMLHHARTFHAPPVLSTVQTGTKDEDEKLIETAFDLIQTGSELLSFAAQLSHRAVVHSQGWALAAQATREKSESQEKEMKRRLEEERMEVREERERVARQRRVFEEDKRKWEAERVAKLDGLSAAVVDGAAAIVDDTSSTPNDVGRDKPTSGVVPPRSTTSSGWRLFGTHGGRKASSVEAEGKEEGEESKGRKWGRKKKDRSRAGSEP